MRSSVRAKGGAEQFACAIRDNDMISESGPGAHVHDQPEEAGKPIESGRGVGGGEQVDCGDSGSVGAVLGTEIAPYNALMAETA